MLKSLQKNVIHLSGILVDALNSASFSPSQKLSLRAKSIARIDFPYSAVIVSVASKDHSFLITAFIFSDSEKTNDDLLFHSELQNLISSPRCSERNVLTSLLN